MTVTSLLAVVCWCVLFVHVIMGSSTADGESWSANVAGELNRQATWRRQRLVGLEQAFSHELMHHSGVSRNAAMVGGNVMSGAGSNTSDISVGNLQFVGVVRQLNTSTREGTLKLHQENKQRVSHPTNIHSLKTRQLKPRRPDPPATVLAQDELHRYDSNCNSKLR